MDKALNINEFFQKIPTLENKLNKSVSIYTAIFGDNDELNEPKEIEKGVDYFCFTDNFSLVSKNWKIILLPSLYLNPRMSARALKILSHKIMINYELSVWIDGSVKITSSILEFLKNYCKKENICTFDHPSRNCIYKEALDCQIKGRDNFNIISNQMKLYKKLKYPKNYGLLMTGILVRRNNTKEVRILNDRWWDVLIQHSNRDQLSFNFILWKYKLKNKVLNQSTLKSFFYIKPHKKINFYSKNGQKINRLRSMLLNIYIKLRRG